MLAEMRAKWRGPQGQSPTPAPTAAQTPPGANEAPGSPEEETSSGSIPSGLAVAEREVLRVLLQEPDLARRFDLVPEDFTDEAHRRLAALALEASPEGDSSGPAVDVAALPEALARLVTELTLRDEPPITEELMQDAVSRIRIHARQRRLMELKDLMAEGALPAGDPRWAEWQELQRQARVSDRSRIAS
jgi:hypothetical protein